MVGHLSRYHVTAAFKPSEAGLFWNVGADGRPFAAACKDVMILERYYTLPSGILQLSAGVHSVNQHRKWI